MTLTRARTFAIAILATCVFVPAAAQTGQPDSGQKAGQPTAQVAPAAGTIKAVRFSGNRVMPSETLERTVHSAPGQTYDPSTVTEDIARVQKLYASHGWTLARVRDAE